MPSQQTILELKKLYEQRADLNRELDRVLTEIHSKLIQEPDYKAWLDGDTLPEWIHIVTGGRPLYDSLQKPIIRREKPKNQQQKLVDSMYSNLMKEIGL